MNDYDYCSKCNRLFDYLDLKPYNLKWYCKPCYREITHEPVLDESYDETEAVVKEPIGV